MVFDYEGKLAEIEQQIKNHVKPQSLMVRDFIWWFAAQRRSYYIVREIRRALKKYNLITQPDFESAYIDEHITFVTAPKESSEQTQPVDGVYADPTYRIGKLASANKPPLSIKPDAQLNEAVTEMLTNDYSQLPVMITEREVKGMISWNSIGSRLALAKKCKHVRDCMEPHHEISADTSLFAAIDTIVTYQYVLIRNSENIVSGIVTTSDLSLQFRQLGEPFLLLGEIENYIRRMIQDKYTKEELIEACDPSDQQREIEGVADLTFGEYLRLLENPDRWSNLKLSIDRSLFVKKLDAIRIIRNDVMHFDPDGIADSDLTKLRHFVRFMQDLANIGVI